jgi:copper oxidase (laccase) domain-containing protein
VLLCDRAGTRVGIAHAGWRGLADGVVEATLAALECAPGELMAWLGPAIGPEAFEVGDEVRTRFVAADEGCEASAQHARRWQADLYAPARRRLAGRHRCGPWRRRVDVRRAGASIRIVATAPVSAWRA